MGACLSTQRERDNAQWEAVRAQKLAEVQEITAALRATPFFLQLSDAELEVRSCSTVPHVSCTLPPVFVSRVLPRLAFILAHVAGRMYHSRSLIFHIHPILCFGCAQEFAGYFELQTFKAGNVIMREGDPADTFYVIGSGAVESYVYEGHRHQHHQHHHQQSEHQSGALVGKGPSSSIDEIDDDECDDDNDYAMQAVEALPPASSSATTAAAAVAATPSTEKEFAPIVAGASPTNSKSTSGGSARQSLFSAPDEIAMSVQKQRRQTVVMGPENQKVACFRRLCLRVAFASFLPSLAIFPRLAVKFLANAARLISLFSL
jgi:hypothetical protein